ncbi:Golgi resident protein GCP60 [Schistocerca americana]|uniref:Golgi resident protein GCP60 n=1 Tax=Schistocerca americana TaxID=7009 RepID=UPI001F4FA1A5|nr:Golgi resident protein GCP60 [Schistocerca americana]XP_049943611.1 Golgi resident protein GCP60 [Schistocerca serialis cubense]
MATNGESSHLDSQLDRLSIGSEESITRSHIDGELSKEDEEALEKWGFQLKDLYRLALRFYKEKEGKAVQLSYEAKCGLVALTCQARHGRYNPGTLPPLGVLDVIGRDRRLAWQQLGTMSPEEAMCNFVERLDNLCPSFAPFIEAHKRDVEEKERLAREEEERQREEDERRRLEEAARQQEEEERAKQELQRRQIQEALNQQTFHQFKAYAEQQYPGNPEQQAVLVRQLQEQHYHQYMQQLYIQQQQQQQQQGRAVPGAMDGDTDEQARLLQHLGSNGTLSPRGEDSDDEDENGGGLPTPSAASMWTRKDIREFKEAIRRESGDAIIKVGHGETVTVRVPTHEDGTCLFWEFATDNYDIGFGVYFEWAKPTTSQVSVHIAESEEEDEEEFDDDEDNDDLGLGDDVERGGGVASLRAAAADASRPPLSVIVPVFRRECQLEVYAGSHVYPGQGVYLLKFDNSYSLWRSKTLYYRVYYTR